MAIIEILREYAHRVPSEAATRLLCTYLDKVEGAELDELKELISEIQAESVDIISKTASGLSAKTLIRLAYQDERVRDKYSDLLQKIAVEGTRTQQRAKNTRAIEKAHSVEKNRDEQKKETESERQSLLPITKRDYQYLPPEVQHAYTAAKYKIEKGKKFKNESGHSVMFDSLNDRDREKYHRILVERAVKDSGYKEPEKKEQEAESAKAPKTTKTTEKTPEAPATEEAEEAEKAQKKKEKKEKAEQNAKARAEELINKAPASQQDKLRAILESEGAEAVGGYLFSGAKTKDQAQKTEDLDAALNVLKAAHLIRIAHQKPHLRARILGVLGY